MRFGVAIATSGRSELLTAVLPHIRSALRPQDCLIVVGASEADWPSASAREGVVLTISPKGSTLQRNAALDHLQDKVDAIVFFDDDFIPASDWLDEAERLLDLHPDVFAFTGQLMADGILGPGLSVEEGLRFLEDNAALGGASNGIDENIPSYGCNMGFRASAAANTRFDPRLRLYAWQEDVDFSSRVATGGRRVRFGGLKGVHLGVKSGRTSGLRLGYAQIMNPIYLVRKGTMAFGHAITLMSKNLLANLFKSIRPEAWVDRRGRLRGNLYALADLCRGRIEPERIERL